MSVYLAVVAIATLTWPHSKITITTHSFNMSWDLDLQVPDSLFKLLAPSSPAMDGSATMIVSKVFEKDAMRTHADSVTDGPL